MNHCPDVSSTVMFGVYIVQKCQV